MERLFSPCTRLHDINIESHERFDVPEGLQELNLDVSTEELLSVERAFTYADLYAMLGNKSVAWLIPHAAVERENERAAFSCFDYRFLFKVDGKDVVALGRSLEHLSEICDVVFRLLAASVVHLVFLQNRGSYGYGALINAPTLAYLMEQCQSLKALTFAFSRN
jgi:hypothetical protein